MKKEKKNKNRENRWKIKMSKKVTDNKYNQNKETTKSSQSK